jgi:predicted N-acetyltransferase YhbS
MIQYRIIAESAMSPDNDRAIKACLAAAFPVNAKTFAVSRAWHGSAPEFSVVAEDDAARSVAGHIGMIVRAVTAGDTTVRVAGVQNFGVHPDRRGGEIGPILMRMALDEARRRDIPHGLLFCVPGLERYYMKSGWVRTDADVTMDYDGKRRIPIPGKNIAMTNPISGAPFPAGPIHLNGADW